MYKLVIVGTILGVSAAYHPINQEIIDAIRARATWKAADIESNPLSKKSYEEIKQMLGLNLHY